MWFDKRLFISNSSIKYNFGHLINIGYCVLGCENVVINWIIYASQELVVYLPKKVKKVNVFSSVLKMQKFANKKNYKKYYL